MCLGRVNFSCCSHTPTVESRVLPVKSGVCNTHQQRTRSHTKLRKGSIVSTIKLSKVYLQFFKRIALINKRFSEQPPSVYKITIRRSSPGVSYKLQDVNTIRWRLGYIAANVRFLIIYDLPPYRYLMKMQSIQARTDSR